jgi:shikimate kinase
MIRLFIIGYMGCGKSLVGERLARIFGCSHCDLDSLIEKEQGVSIDEIFKLHGAERFRKMELEALTNVAKMENVIVSVGGGTPCFFDNMDVMNRSGITVYLESDAQELYDWLKEDRDGRPLLAGLKDNELRLKISDMLSEREPYYKKAKYTVRAGKGAIEPIVKIINENFK